MKPDISHDSFVELSAPKHVEPGDPIDLTFKFKNGSQFALNGAQAVVTLPEAVSFDSVSQGTATQNGRDVVVSLGRVLPGSTVTLVFHGHVSAPAHGDALHVSAALRSGTALPVPGGHATITVHKGDRDD